MERIHVKAFLLLASVLFRTCMVSACKCATTGLSNGVRVDELGCALRPLQAKRATCFVESSVSCARAKDSEQFAGASFIFCPLSDALFDAAQRDDAKSIIRLRKLRVDLKATRNVTLPDGKSQTMTAISYAAAYGSFAVVEDLLVNEDFSCEVGVPLQTALCLFSDEPKCDKQHSLRIGITRLIAYIYADKCEPVDRSMSTGTFPGSGQNETRRLDDGVSRLRFGARFRARAPCDEHPFFVSVRFAADSYRHACGGVLVAKDAVLTAAHCLDGNRIRHVPILFIEAQTTTGSGDCDQTAETRKGERVVFHKNWSKGKYSESFGNGRDVALIKLNKPSTKKPIKLTGVPKIEPGHSLRFIGLGKTSRNSGFSPHLQISSLSLESRDDCRRAYANGLDKKTLCASNSNGGGYCLGDDGGPLFLKNDKKEAVLIGIAHMLQPGAECGDRETPGVYSDVRSLKKWIKNSKK